MQHVVIVYTKSSVFFLCNLIQVDQAVAMAFGDCRRSNYVRIQVHFRLLLTANRHIH